jgi:DNA-binding MarR family transcriptional regulator
MAMDIREELFQFVDRVHDVISQKRWASILFDLSKNDFFAILFIYRKETATMSDFAAYLHTPLNTATGVISRLEKKGLVDRKRSREDKRVMTVTISESGKQMVVEIIRQITHYGEAIFRRLSDEEMQAAFSIVQVVMKLLEEEKIETPNALDIPVRKIEIE